MIEYVHAQWKNDLFFRKDVQGSCVVKQIDGRVELHASHPALLDFVQKRLSRASGRGDRLEPSFSRLLGVEVEANSEGRFRTTSFEEEAARLPYRAEFELP